MKSLTVSAIVGLVVLSCAVYIPSEAEAAINHYWTLFPCSSNSYMYYMDEWALSIYLPEDPYTVDTPGITANWDGEYEDIRTPDYTIRYVYAMQFWNTGSWVQYYDYTTAWFPPEDATIYGVYIVAEFQNATHTPSLFLSYSVDGGADYENSNLFVGDTGTTNTNGTHKVWDVTDDREWDNDTFNSNDFIVRMVAAPIPGPHFYLDYLGVKVSYGIAPGPGYLPEEDIEEPSAFDPDYMFIYTAAGMFSVMGLIGMGGMIATPALTIFAYQRSGGGSKAKLFIGSIVTFLLCFTLLMASIGQA